LLGSAVRSKCLIGAIATIYRRFQGTCDKPLGPLLTSGIIIGVKVLAISGSLRAGSLNTKLLKAVRDLPIDHLSMAIYEQLRDLPHYDADIDDEEPPPPVCEFRKRLAETDAIMISSPEYAHGIPGAFKNALDWAVSSGEFVDKPVLLINVASTGGGRAQEQLLQVLKVMTANVICPACFTSAQVRNGIDERGAFSDAALRDTVLLLLSRLQES